MKMKKSTMKQFIYAVMLCTSAFMARAGVTDQSHVVLSDIEVGRRGDEMVVKMMLPPKMMSVGRDHEITFTPVICSLGSADSVALPSFTVAGRNRYYSRLRDGDLSRGMKVYRAGHDPAAEYHAEVPYQDWMERCRVVMREDVASCCNQAESGTMTPLAELDYRVAPFVPERRCYVALTGDSAVVLTAEGKAFVDFVVNRTDLNPSYRGNTREIAKIIESIDRVKNDPDATITLVSIKGYASPEGSYANNVRLAMGRTATLKEYVRKHYSFDPEIMRTDFEPEDWEGLREWVMTCDLPHRTEILGLIDSNLEPDTKDRTIKERYPEDYKIILADVYPALRHSDYKVKYSIRTYTDIEELKRVFASTPERLRPVDFSRIAATYPSDSPEYKDVFMKAVEIYPDDELANLNAANIALERGDCAAASRYLLKAGDSPEAIYTRGLLAAQSGDFDRAARYMELAAGRGLEDASFELERLQSQMREPKVKYLVDTVDEKGK